MILSGSRGGGVSVVFTWSGTRIASKNFWNRGTFPVERLRAKEIQVPEISLDFGVPEGESFEPSQLDDDIELGKPHIMTALGPISPDAAGFTLPQEHVYCRPLVDDPDLRLDDPSRSLAELEDAALLGIRTIVDLTTSDYGRCVEEIRWIAQRSPVHLIVATGFQPQRWSAQQIDKLAIEEMVASNISEIRDGIEGQEIHAGVITAGTSAVITATEESVLRAAARSHLETGVPISTQTTAGTMALEQIRILTSEGVHPSRIVLGGLNVAVGYDRLMEILATGASVCCHGFGRLDRDSDERTAAMIDRLVSAGHVAQIQVSGMFARRSLLLNYDGAPGFRFVAERVPILLMEAGLAAADVRALLVENPAHSYTIQP